MMKFRHVAFLSTLLISSFVVGREVRQEDGAYFLSLGYGEAMKQYEVGVGIRPMDGRAGFGGLVVRRLELNNKQTISGKRPGVDKATITAIGVRGFAVQVSDESDKGADLTFAVSQTTAGDYERTGLDIRGVFFAPVAPSLSWFAGFSIRPEFLSFNWSTDALTEVGLEAGLDWRLSPNIGISTQFRSESIVTDDVERWHLAQGVDVIVQMIW